LLSSTKAVGFNFLRALQKAALLASYMLPPSLWIASAKAAISRCNPFCKLVIRKQSNTSNVNTLSLEKDVSLSFCSLMNLSSLMVVFSVVIKFDNNVGGVGAVEETPIFIAIHKCKK
jgi:hypothetical protein